MDYANYLNGLSDRFENIILSSINVSQIHTEDFGWINKRYRSELFRMAHIERYSDANIEVLHITTFPHPCSPEPIFGFDVITTKNGVTGCYMDLSPIINTYPFDDGVDFKERKPLPEWATVFSDRFILLKPVDDGEFTRFCDWVIDRYDWYVNSLLWLNRTASNFKQVVEKQNHYCKIQSQNPRTFSALKAKIGEERAKYFMKEILFPQI